MSGRRERGQAGGVEALAFGLLVFVVGMLLVASAWAVVDAKAAVVAAAREAARTYVESASLSTAEDRARAAADEALAGHGRHGGRVELMQPPTFERCAPVQVRVAYQVRAVPLPWIGGLGTIEVAATRTERIDPYRDGLAGAARCAP